ncbi:MAG: YabP/YqfC family sporulation protein [Clostridia bacterium]
MEPKIKPSCDNTIHLKNRKQLSITGISKVQSISDKQILLETCGHTLQVLGSGMEVKKLDVESGELEVEGEIDCMKYLGAKQKGGLLKRIFK